MAVWQVFWVERRNWMENRRVFWRFWQIVTFRRHRKVERASDSLYRTKRRVHWEIKPIFAKKINSCLFYHVNIKHPSIYWLHFLAPTLFIFPCKLEASPISFWRLEYLLPKHLIYRKSHRSAEHFGSHLENYYAALTIFWLNYPTFIPITIPNKKACWKFYYDSYVTTNFWSDVRNCVKIFISRLDVGFGAVNYYIQQPTFHRSVYKSQHVAPI